MSDQQPPAQAPGAPRRFGLPNDTHPDAARVQLELLRRATPDQRLALMNMLIKMTRQLSWDGLRAANPDLSEAELDILFLRVNYGDDIADRVKRRLADRR